MTIVASEDSRNQSWSKKNVGSRLLEKMGWSEGQGLGKRKQGQATALRAVRRSDETLGIGAETDVQGSQGWEDTSNSFTAVLQSLQQHHDMDEKKKKRRRSNGGGLTLARNKVTAGHAQKMLKSKDLSGKSESDMAAIFGTKSLSRSSSVLSQSNDEKSISKKKRSKKKRRRDAEERDSSKKKRAEKKKQKEEESSTEN